MNKGLEALDWLNDLGYLKSRNIDTDSKALEKIEIIEKELKTLEIIRNTRILSPYETCGGKCWLETMADAVGITKENYDLLKEVLE